MRTSLLRAFSALFLASQSYAATSFTYNNDTFLLDGEPYQIIGGQMDPQRIPYQYWEDRLYKARAMGLNTIFSYVFWDQIQPTPDTWDTTGRNDIAGYFRIAQEVGLNIVLRAGPYVCGEHEWGGFPAWLSEAPGMVVRSYNQPFLDAAQEYIGRLASELEPLMVTNGGPVIMVQIENEYGSYGADHTYMAALRDMFKTAFGITLYTNDGGYESDLVGGAISGVLAETDGSPQSAFAARDEYVTDPSSLGPQLDGEYYITWLDFWASNYTYETDVGSASAIKTIQADISWVLANGFSFSLYMFHGGTNWDFQSGADWGTALEPVITSYDYGAPLDESGRTTDIYDALRETISSFLSNSSTLPSVPQNTEAIGIPDFEVSPIVALFDVLPQPVTALYPIHMEALNQSHGFVLYRHTMESAMSGTLQPGDFPRDRVLVYVNAKRVGVIDSSYQTPNVVNLALNQNDVLDLLIENMGRINYGPRIPDQRKGVIGNVTIGGVTLSDWAMYSISLDDPPTQLVTTNSLNPSIPSESGPIFYSATFDVTEIGDTFLELPNWTKGVVWVNGINLGRYWIVGPQQTLYLPGCYLKDVGNQIVVLDLEPSGNETVVRGVTTRNWGNFPDPDAPPN